MSFRQSLAANVTPLILRIGLAATFLWAGWGKVLETRDYKPEELARLATMGVDKAQLAARGSGASARPVQPSREVEADRRAPAESAPAAPLPDPATPKPSNKSSSGPGGGQRFQPMHPAAAVSSEHGDEAATASSAAPAQPSKPARVYSAGDFDGPAPLKKVYSLALLLDARSKPAPAADGKPAGALWPSEWSKGMWPVYFAWGAGLTELLGGGLVLIGLLARLSGLSLAAVMLVAAWLTSVGPNLGAGFLGLAPPWSSFADWTTFLFQVMLLCAALGVFFSGAGAVSLDHWLFSRDKSAGDGGGEE